MLRRADAPDGFVADPQGSYVAGANYVVWCHDQSCDGLIVWGRPTEADAREITRCYDYLRPGVARRDILTDARGMGSLDSAAFAYLWDFARSRQAAISPTVRRHAVVHADGLPGAAAAGFLSAIGATHEWRPFTEVEAALAWLGHPALIDSIGQLELMALSEQTTPAPLRALRHLLAGAPHHTTLAAAARELGMSTRTLQRALAEAATSFRREHDRAWRDRAVSLLLDDDAKLESIAKRLGCPSLSAFDSRFARLVGKTPTEHRQARRVMLRP